MPKKTTTKEKTTKKPKPKAAKYYEAVGRRKTATARARLFVTGAKTFLVNDKPYEVYFPVLGFQQTARASLESMKCLDKFRIIVKAKGGGVSAQAEAVRHALARVLVKFNPEFGKHLRKLGFLTRDARMRERKKPGLKRARRAPQWSKR